MLRDIHDRGRSLEQILHQYTTLVKPAFEEFCIPVSPATAVHSVWDAVVDDGAVFPLEVIGWGDFGRFRKIVMEMWIRWGNVFYILCHVNLWFAWFGACMYYQILTCFVDQNGVIQIAIRLRWVLPPSVVGDMTGYKFLASRLIHRHVTSQHSHILHFTFVTRFAIGLLFS